MRILIICILLGFASCSSNPIVKPNVIFIIVDDLGWSDAGFMGSVFYDTPHIDKLAQNGIVFNRAYAAAAVCSPTRASILTGRYPTRIGITDWIRGRYSGIEIPPDKKNPTGYEKIREGIHLQTPRNPFWMEHSEITMAELLKENGYTSAHVGKWHLGPDEWSPLHQGFDYNFGGEDYGQPPTYFDPYERNGFAIESLPPREEGEYLTDRESTEAVNFIRKHKDTPFYLALNHYAVHTPIMAKEDYTKEFIKKRTRLNIPWNEGDRVSERFKTRIPLENQNNATYAAMIKSIDESVGKIVATLKELGLYENTILVFYSDNGGHIVSTDNSPLRSGKGHPYEGGIRVPLIFHWPTGITKPGTNNTPVHSVDFLPTILKMTNTNLPDLLTIDGVDISSTFDGTELNPRTLYWHFPHYWWGTKVKPYSIIQDGNWKLIYWYESGETELYNLESDVSEKVNMAMENKDLVLKLKEKLSKWITETGGKIPLDPDADLPAS